ncbi:hypothetical protein BDY21DRAFT_367286 [Lineolata rhizophorae]|uniref:Aminoglycoside phosphotransferase domain-containing protein n=1 Tax=Lineolata rhizophorae TaxID=578093 RepID=A0A6A6NMW2_9PEZI|nr:hypothetical protein BDY21DRAFT_367286 [Lineolata rhizophorae]
MLQFIPAGVALAETPAMRYNRQIMDKLQKALAAHPEVDLASIVPKDYSNRLLKRKITKPNSRLAEELHGKSRKLNSKLSLSSAKVLKVEDLRDATVDILFPLSEPVRQIFQDNNDADPTTAENIDKVLGESAILFRHPVGGTVVLDCKPGIVVKVTPNSKDLTEYTTLQYLETVHPYIPAPRPSGAAKVGRYCLFFMSRIDGSTLEEVWPKLNHALKCSVQDHLNSALLKMRPLRRSEDQQLGGVAGERCKDLRRHVRVSDHPILTAKEFEDFQFSNPHYGSDEYIRFLRSLSPPLADSCVFTHGDLRPENIMVNITEESCILTGIIDWEFSGFYPDYQEAIKVTNSLAPNERSDWFDYLPDCISPRHHSRRWLLDRLWWKHVE